ncbi:hypothetical protein LINPERPRIM_LOCUS14031 [Linum perenne]
MRDINGGNRNWSHYSDKDLSRPTSSSSSSLIMDPSPIIISKLTLMVLSVQAVDALQERLLNFVGRLRRGCEIGGQHLRII